MYEDGPGLVSDLIDAIADQRVSACLDIGHAHANSTTTLRTWIEYLGNRIRYAHLHNNDGVRDDHYEIGRGKMDAASVLNLLQQHAPNARWSIETNAAEKSLRWLVEHRYLKM